MIGDDPQSRTGTKMPIVDFALRDESLRPALDDITRSVAVLCDVPIAIISFVDGERERFQSVVGLAIDGINRDVSFCEHAFHDDAGVLIVNDALLDRRFWNNPFVVGMPRLRFYAGVALQLPSGSIIGALSIVDLRPRSLSAQQLQSLTTAGATITALIEYDRLSAALKGSGLAASGASALVAEKLQDRVQRAPVDRLADSSRVRVRADFALDVIESVPGIFYLVDSAGTMLMWNRCLEAITGYTAAELTAIAPLELIAKGSQKYVGERIRHAFVHGTASVDAAIVTKDGRSLPYYLTAKIVEYENRICLAGVGIDISDLKQSQDLLEHAVTHDPLTGLGNRTQLSDRLTRATRSFAQSDGQVAVIFLDLDHFKRMNDALGHDAGDEILKIVAHRLRSSIRSTDMVARFGGDEFVIVSDITKRDDVHALIVNIRKSLASPISVNGQHLHVTASMGVTVYPSDAVEPMHLLRNADAALYRSKDAGRNVVTFFTSDMYMKSANRLNLENDLRFALANGELEVVYQPVIDLRAGITVSAEALLRWNHPLLGTIAPLEFIPIAEELGLIVQIGSWVLREAAGEAVRLSALGLRRCYISVNVSGVQLRDPGFLDEVLAAIGGTKIVPRTLGLEMTEAASLGNADKAVDILLKCKEMGLLVLLDDFGTHYASLTYLRKLPIDVIKIDKSFVDGIPHSTGDAEILKAIVSLARGSGCEVIAEGVEQIEQARWLLANECFLATGYLFARPMQARELEAWLTREPIAPLWSSQEPREV